MLINLLPRNPENLSLLAFEKAAPAPLIEQGAAFYFTI